MNTGFNNCGCGGCGCSVCQPANVIYQSSCPDPGSATFGAHIVVLDQNFCERRLTITASGFIVATLTPNGVQVSSTPTPAIDLADLSVVSGGTIGTLVIQGSDNKLYGLALPNVANLYLSTNASGQLVLGPLPAFTVPDPLTVTTANITNLTASNLTLTGAAVLSGLAAGTIASTIGLDGSNNLVKGSPSSTGVQSAMFFESPTSPSAATPNGSATAGSFLVIGNQLYDSGGSLITVTNSQKLTVAVAGKYRLDFCGQLTYTGGGSGKPALNLMINGIVVNTGNARPSASTTTDRVAFMDGFEYRDLSVGDTIELQLASTSGTNTHVYEVRIGAQKFA